MNNKIIFSTDDGIKIKVEFNGNSYEYLTSSLSIDTSELIKALAESEIIEPLDIDSDSIINYMFENETSGEFRELSTFLQNIPKAYNKSIEQLQVSE